MGGETEDNEKVEETEDNEKVDGVTSPSQKKEDKGQEKGEGGTPPSQRKDSNEMPRPRKDERVRQREVDSGARKGPIRCYYKGKHRIIHDGGGLTSPGRLPVEEREEALGEEGTMVASEVRQMFLEWIQSKSEGKEDGVKECFWKLAGGKFQESPFGASMERFKSSRKPFPRN